MYPGSLQSRVIGSPLSSHLEDKGEKVKVLDSARHMLYRKKMEFTVRPTGI